MNSSYDSGILKKANMATGKKTYNTICKANHNRKVTILPELLPVVNDGMVVL